MGLLERLHVTVSGRPDGQPMVFAHGFGCDQQMWRLTTPAFADEFKIVLFDHVGSGRSDLSAYDPQKYDSLAGYAEDVVEVCAAVSGGRPVVLVGHSVSAMIAVLAAVKAPELFDRLVLVGPSARYVDDEGYVGGFSRQDVDELLDAMESNYLGWSGQLAPVVMGNPDRPALGAELEQSFCRTDPDIARQFARVTFLGDNRADLPQVTIPSLVLQCRDDAIAPISAGEYVRDHLPDSTYELLDAVGHCPHLSAPEQTVAAITRFLRTP